MDLNKAFISHYVHIKHASGTHSPQRFVFISHYVHIKPGAEKMFANLVYHFISHYVHIKPSRSATSSWMTWKLYIPLRSYKTLSRLHIWRRKRLFISHYVHIKRYTASAARHPVSHFISHYVHIKQVCEWPYSPVIACFISHYVHIKRIRGSFG